MREIVVEDRPWAEIEAEYTRDPLTRLIDAQAGVVALWQARLHLTEKAIRHRVGSGRWRRVHRAIFQTYGGRMTIEQQRWMAVLAATAGPSIRDSAAACLGGISALQVHGLRNISADGVHVVVPPQRQIQPPAGVAVHRMRLGEGDRHPLAMPPATTAGRSLVDAAAWARSDDEARLIIAASLQQRLVTATEVDAILARTPATFRRQLVIATVRDAAGGSHSLGELAFVRICRTAGLPVPTRQARFRDGSGRLRILDAVFDRWRVAVEVDGAQHDDVQQAWDDAERDNDLTLAGYRVLRFPLQMVRQQPRRVAVAIRAALELAGWQAKI